jgi:transcriptional regulator with XRE-family HTH domain
MDSKTKATKPADIYVGAQIRLRRNMLGLSQTEMGEQIGVTFQQVQKYEKGVNRIGASRLLQICEVLDCTPADLFKGAPGSRKASAASRHAEDQLTRFHGNPYAADVIRVFPRLPKTLQRILVGLMVNVGEAPR